MEFPTISIHESFSHPTSMYMRNLMSIDTEEMVRAQPMDAVVVIGGLDAAQLSARFKGLSTLSRSTPCGLRASYVPSGVIDLNAAHPLLLHPTRPPDAGRRLDAVPVPPSGGVRVISPKVTPTAPVRVTCEVSDRSGLVGDDAHPHAARHAIRTESLPVAGDSSDLRLFPLQLRLGNLFPSGTRLSFLPSAPSAQAWQRRRCSLRQNT